MFVLQCLLAPDGTEVLDREWEVQSLHGGTYSPDHLISKSFIFPEFEDKAPFRLTGTRLVERSGFIADAEIVVVRLNDTAPLGYDLLIYEDTGHPVAVETEDDALFVRLQQAFEAE